MIHSDDRVSVLGISPSAAHLAFFVGRPRFGGAERVLLTIASEFARRGHRVDMLFARREGPLLAEIPETIRTVELGVPGAIGCLPQVLRLPPAVWRIILHPANPSLLRSTGPLADYLRKHRPDGLLSTLRSENLAAIWAARLANSETRIVVREANTQSVQSESESSPLKRGFPAIARRWFPLADATVAVSRSAAADLVRNTGLPAESIETIHNPVDVAHIQARAAEPLEDSWFQDAAPPVFVTAGRLVEQKDQETLVRAFARVRAGREARLLILGEGPKRASLEHLISELGIADDVRLPGAVANPQVYFGRARTFVLSSGWEGFPNVLVEALSCGCPIVSTDCPGGAAEILGDGEFGTLVPMADPVAMAQAMANSLDAPANRDRLHERAMVFTVERAVDAYASLLLAPAAEADVC